MNKIKSFNKYSKNEEFFHGYAGSGKGESGLSWLNNAFEWLGDKFGFEVDILSRYLKSKVEDNQLDEAKASELAKVLLTRVGGKSREEIESMVDSEIGNV